MVAVSGRLDAVLFGKAEKLKVYRCPVCGDVVAKLKFDFFKGAYVCELCHEGFNPFENFEGAAPNF